MTTTTTTELLRLLAWLSPAFPTGGYAYSHGLEWAVETREVHNAPTLRAWVEDILRHGAGRSDAILLGHAHAASGDSVALASITEFALAAQATRERLTEAVGQGNAFSAGSASWHPAVLRDLAARVGDIPYAVAVGALAGAHGINVDAACAGMLQAFAANLVSAAVRLVPLGQSDGLSVLAGLEQTIIAVCRETRGATLDDVGGACFRADIASMRHETQYSRLFRS